jgi:cathepsin F/cysteine peptidase B
MFKSILFLCLVLAAAARYLPGDSVEWSDFKTTYNKHYNAAEEKMRYRCFIHNLNQIDALTKSDTTAVYGVTKFADMCPEEFQTYYHNLNVTASLATKKYNYRPLVDAKIAQAAAADSADWRQKGAVTHVKNQGQCGSCWSFSATGNMEGQHFLKTGSLVTISEEELVQCSSAAGNQGCKGGLMDDAFTWVVTNGGIDGESDYPYTSGMGTTGTCQQNKLKSVVATFTGHQDIAKDEDQMAAFVASSGPLAVAVDAGIGWQLYTGGIKSSCFAGTLDHGVLIVGYGTDGSTPYWIVKNSWGATWGEQGYIRLKRGENCNGIRESASSATA